MIGAIVGDIVGSPYETHPIRTKDFPLFQASSRFTDDTILTCAVAFSILSGRSYQDSIRDLCWRHANRGYGNSFRAWLAAKNPAPYNSYGNGAAMRVSPIGFAFESADLVLEEAAKSAEITHNHPDGIAGAQAAALTVFLARKGRTKEQIRNDIQRRFRYDLTRTVSAIRKSYGFNVSCQKTVPEAIIAFLDSTSYEDTLRNAVSLGGDSDTLACIAGGIAQAYYKEIPGPLVIESRRKLTRDLLVIIELFEQKYIRTQDTLRAGVVRLP